MPNCESCGYEAKNDHGLKIHSKKHMKESGTQETTQPQTPTVDQKESTASAPAQSAPQPSPTDVLLQRISELERRDEENQKKLKMLYDVADKGRLFNWESKQKGGDQGRHVKLSVVDGKILVGWRTLRDELVHDPKTGRTVGEFQQYELLLYGEDGQHSTRVVDGYLNFSNLRYENRIECQILGKSENYEGKVTFEIGLPDGRKTILDSRFVN